MNARRRWTDVTFSFVALAALAALATSLGGCHACEDLNERICNDLGAADCKFYRESGLADKMLPAAGRGRNKACSMMSNEPAYAQVLKGIRIAIDAQKKADAAQKAAGAPVGK